MAFRLSQKRKLNCVRIVSVNDDAIDLEKSDIDLYRKDPIKNESAIKFKQGQEPTVFICNFELSGKEVAIIKDAMVSGVDADSDAKMSFGKWAYTTCKLTLKEIQNPPNIKDGIELKKDSRGYVDEFTMTILERFGIVSEINNHYANLTSSDVKEEAKNS